MRWDGNVRRATGAGAWKRAASRQPWDTPACRFRVKNGHNPARARSLLLIQSGHEWPVFAAMHGRDLLHLVDDPWPWGKAREAAGVHHTFGRRGGFAARGASAAAGDAGCYSFVGSTERAGEELIMKTFSFVIFVTLPFWPVAASAQLNVLISGGF